MSKPPYFEKKVRAYTLLHRRLGHSGYSTVSRLLREKMVLDLPADLTGMPEGCPGCETCALCKSCRLPFPASESKTRGPLELVHLDLMGPLPPSLLQQGVQDM